MNQDKIQNNQGQSGRNFEKSGDMQPDGDKNRQNQQSQTNPRKDQQQGGQQQGGQQGGWSDERRDERQQGSGSGMGKQDRDRT
ncbi:MAG TPA: hypothetical protein VFB16_06030 [Bauldia sp.]|nr:hypothetical protein [Bauldia sp.]